MAQGILNTPREVTHQRIAAALEAIEQNISDEHEAVNIDYDNTYSGLSADNVQEAIDELVNEKANTADLGTASAKNFTTSVTQGSNDLVTSGAVYNEFANLPKPEIFKGTLGVNGTITSLPTASSDNEGWEYKVITAGTYAGQDAKYGDTFISDGTQWVYIPSGDETDTDTWRGINVNGSQLLGSGISSGNVNFKSGTNAQVSGSGNDITVDVDTTFSDASSRTNIASGDSIKTILGKIKKWFSDLKTVAFSGSYNDLDNKPTIPSVGDGTLKIQKNGTNVATFTANQSGDVTVNIQCVDTVDSVMSDSSTNPLQNKVITKELEGAKTATGNPLTIEDAAPVNAVNLSMDLEPIQDLHGYDHPWVGGAGKNKLHMTGSDETVSGVTYTKLLDNDSNVIGIKCVGTISGTSAKYLSTDVTLPAGTYILTGGSGVSSTGIRLVAVYSENDAVKYREVTTEQGITFTLSAETQVAFYLRGEQTNLAVNTIIYPMIRLSTETDSSFAPYTNICPISGRTEEVITQKDNPTNPTVTKTYTIQIGQTVYGGHLDVTNGKMVVDKMIYTLNTSSMNYEDSSNNIIGWAMSSKPIRDYVGSGLDKYFDIPTNISANYFINTQYSDDVLGVIISNYSMADLVAMALDVQVVLELATPFTIDLTPTQIKLLENTNTLYTDYEGDTITIEYQPNNAIGEAVRAVEESYDPEFAVRPVLKKKAFSGTTDSDGAVTLINASDIPSNHRIIPLQITDMTIGGSAGTYFVEYEPYNSGDSVKGYCYTYFNGSQITPVGSAVTGNFYYYELEG